MECVRGATGAYQLTFSYSELYKSKVSSVVSLKQGEPLEVGGVVRDLNEKSKAFGIPYKEVVGQDKIRYELKVN